MIRMLQLEITGECQLECTHCFAKSGPGIGHGTLTTTDWIDVIDQTAQLGIPRVQFIGGEPTRRPDLPDLVNAALINNLGVEVYTNLVHVPQPVWDVLGAPGVTVATSWYTDDRDEHEAITGRDTWRQTLANIQTTLNRRIPLRAGMVRLSPTQRVAEGKALLHGLGIEHVGIDQMRGLGRAAADGIGDVTQLCGNCGVTVAAVLPDGQVAGCPMSRFLPFGNIRTEALGILLARLAPVDVPPRPIQACGPDNDGQCNPCEPSCNPGCDPGVCSPFTPALALTGHGCNPDSDGNDCSPAETDWTGDGD